MIGSLSISILQQAINWIRLYRLLCPGDILALPVPDSAGQSALLQALYHADSDSKGWPRGGLMYFRVTQLSPAWGHSLLIDPKTTAVQLEVTPFT